MTCKQGENGYCDGALDLSQIVQCNIDIRTIESEVVQLRARSTQDSQLLTSMSAEVKASQATLNTSKSSGVDGANQNRMQSELQQLLSTAKPIFERQKANKLAHVQLMQRLEQVRDHEANLFVELLSQVRHRTVNDCSECATTGKICIFSDESEQCNECQKPPRRRCQGSVDDDDADRIKAALDTIDGQIEEILSLGLSDKTLYSNLKERLKHEEDATMAYRSRSGLSPQELEDHSRLTSQLMRTRKELEALRDQSLIDDAGYQELRIRRRLINECHSELLQRAVCYYDELEELAGYPERRGHKRVEEMDHDEYRDAVEWALEHPGEWPDTASPVETQSDQDVDMENASDSGIEV